MKKSRKGDIAFFKRTLKILEKRICENFMDAVHRITFGTVRLFDIHIIVRSIEVCDTCHRYHGRFGLRENTLKWQSLSQRRSLN